MPLPDVEAVAVRAGVPANDPRAQEALSVALSWARDALARAVDDALADLNEVGYEAVLGAAADFVKLPQVQAAMADPANDVPSSLPLDIGRRWAGMLQRGNKHLWAVR